LVDLGGQLPELVKSMLEQSVDDLADLADNDWRKTNPRFTGENFQRNLRVADEVEAVAAELGAEQIIIMGRHPARIALARDFGATDVVSERGEEAVERVRKLTFPSGAPTRAALGLC
jgi:hypothetical protein